MKTKLITTIMITLFLASVTISAIPVKAESVLVTITYPDIYTLPPGGGFFWLPHIWDLTECDVTISYTLDLTEAPNQAYYWTQGTPKFAAGYVGLVWPGSPWAGALMCGFLTDWDNPDTLFPTFPDKDATLDMDDKLNMQRFPNPEPWDETLYDVHCDPYEIISPPFGSYDNYGIWFDRDGVDPWQALMWGSVDGGTYNTGGVYEVQLTYRMYDSTKGTACPLLFPSVLNPDSSYGYGVPTGFDHLPGWTGYQHFPAGISFDTDETKMAYMKVFVSGDSGDGTIVVRDLTVTGCLASTPENVIVFLEDLKDEIEGLPNGVFKNPKAAEGQREALLNKIDAVISQVEAGAYTGAINKLEKDVKDKIVKWIVDTYTQKADLIEKVNLIINILESL